MSSGIKQIDGYKIYMSKKLGQGSYGAVYIGTNDDTGEEVAVKILKKSDIDSDEYLKSALFSEIKIMQSVKSENIVGFYDVMQSSKNYYIVQQLCDGDLSSLMKKEISEEEAKNYLLQIASGFLALVREGIVHRDMKPANVMRKGNTLKIGDFGFAKKTQISRVQNQTIVGTPLYMSLQILKSQPYSSKCDIWAIGFIFYEMLHKRTPWIGKSQYDLIKKIQTRPLEVDPKFSDETVDFLQRALQKEEKNRMSWDQLFTHQIFGGHFIEKSDKKQFENKLKSVMRDLRFQINANNLDLCKILAGLGHNEPNSQLDKGSFYQFLSVVSQQISKAEAEYIFDKIDDQKQGRISVKQIEQLMIENNISLTSVWRSIPGISIHQKNSFGIQEPPKMSEEQEAKIRGCFVKLLRILEKKKLLLYDVFANFDKGKSGNLTREQFKRMLVQLSDDLSNDEINGAFDLIDSDNSNSIEFDEFNKYFSKVNGIPEHMNRPQSKNDFEQPKSFHRMFNQQAYQPVYQQPPPMGYGYQGYPMYPPNMYPPQQPQQQYGGGFIMNQLSQNMSGQQQPQYNQNWQKKP